MLKSIVLTYGSAGLFTSSLLGSTIFFPFARELLFLPLIKAGVSRYKIVLYSAVGSVLGTYLNYLIGWYGIKIAYRHKNSTRLNQFKRYIDKYGWLGVFIIFVLPLPLPVDPLAILIGLTKMEWKRFLITIFLAKIVKYSLAVGLFSLI
ncbi:MAG: VTT domain-containing protein [Candidatus Altiarchaeota archaeon]